MFKAPRGTLDLLDDQAWAWYKIRQAATEFFTLYGYTPIETPSFEVLDVFVRGIGQSTDVVGKEMFFVNSKQALEKIDAGESISADEQLALRPEMTAGVVRAIVEHNLVPPGGNVVKLSYAASMYRHERPQKGRLREFHQLGVECVGSDMPEADAEAIVMLMRFFAKLGIDEEAMVLKLNSMGDDNCRPRYRELVRDYIRSHSSDLCPECQRRADTNPLRAFDCKNPGCKKIMDDAPKISDALCSDCKLHFEQVKLLLDWANINYCEDARLVRGLDYYNRTVFEVQVSEGLGSQSAIGGGGRYDKLIEEFGGKPTPGLGFAIGFERVMLALKAAGKANYDAPKAQVYLALVDQSLKDRAFVLASRLRDAGIAVDFDLQARSLKSQFKQADRQNSRFVIILGPDEWQQDQVKLRIMETREEINVALTDLENNLKGQLQR